MKVKFPKKMSKILSNTKHLIFLFLFSFGSFSQSDSIVLNEIYKTSLTHGKTYEWLDFLSNQIGGRLSGSLIAERAVNWAESELIKLGLDEVRLQPVMVPKWVRGNPEFAYVETKPGKTLNMNVCALGGSVSTPPAGIKAKVVEVSSFDQLEALGRDKVEGKIVFYNRAMDKSIIDTFKSYGGCVDQRYDGAFHAAKLGAVAIIVRSMTLAIDDLPHTGSMSYGNLSVQQRIPAAAISTKDADLLSSMLKMDNSIKFFLKQNCKQLDDVLSYNVIGEIKGSEFPDEYILVGGHLDYWDLGDGSHDDGAGCVQSMEVLRLFKVLEIKPKRTLRVVLFMNEENGLRGAKKYASESRKNKENHIFALESDAGAFTPRGFYFEADPKNFNQILSWKDLFEPYLIHFFELGGSGSDLGPLKNSVNVLAGLKPDSQRYFDHHHSSNDIFSTINKRELEIGAATMASLVYLFDKYGLVKVPKL